MDVTVVRWFNLIYAVILALLVARRLFQRGYRVYKYANFAYLASFIYSIIAYAWTFYTGVPMPVILSAFGATIQLSAMLIAVYTQVEWHK